MKFDDYQKQAITTDVFTESKNKELFSLAFMEKVLGISGETGELADKIKKIIRDQKGTITDGNKTEITKELGDILWYISALAYYLGIPLNKIAEENIKKLSGRKTRGVISGSGDNR